LQEIFGADKLAKAEKKEADYFANAIFINNSNFSFTVKVKKLAAKTV